MEVKPGYKQTEVGLIPEEWDVKLLPEVCRFRSGKAHEQYISDIGRCVCVNSKFIATDGAVRKFSTANFCPAKKSDVLMVMSDLPNGRALAKAYLVEADDTYAVNQRVCALTAYRDCPEYLFYVLNRNPYFLKFDDGVSQTHLLNAVFQKCPLPVPRNVIEQRAIAAALSDMDRLLGGLDRLIAKKRDLKQAAMQQLLTGQTRLPGFHGEWQETQVQDVISGFFCGPSPTCEERNIQGDEWGVLKTTAATKENGWDWTKHKTLPRVYWNKPQIELRKGDVIVTKAGPRHRVGVTAWVDFVPPRIIPSGKMIALRPHPNKVVPLMLAASIAARDAQTYLDQRTTGMAESQVNFENIALLEAPIVLPRIEEQTAIAEVLTDMDMELAALEQWREKTRALKQAMMQELLTGRIRLLPNSSSATVLPFEDSASPAQPKSKKPAHNWAFNEAVVISVLAAEFGSTQFPLGRMRYTKLAYMLHRHVEHVAQGYLKKAAGPYNPATRYAGPEKIACESGYIKRHKRDQFEGFVADEKNAQARAYFIEWYGQAALDWLQQFRFWKKEELERVATVDMAMEELRRDNREVTVDSVKRVIASAPDWLPKLDRAVFADAHLCTAIQQCRSLFPIC